MDETLITAVCERHGFAGALCAPEPVPGGLIHRVWRLTTTGRVVAVKVLDRRILARPGVFDAYVRSERLAARMAAGGIPAVTALDGPDGPVARIGGDVLIVYPWIDGSALPRGAVDMSYAWQMGTILARLHALGMRDPEADSLRPDAVPDGWARWAAHAEADHDPLAPYLRAAMPELERWSADTAEAWLCLAPVRVISHRDLDQKNVLWRDAHTPQIIDWEAAGPIHPTVDLLSMACDWSGGSGGHPSPDAFSTLVAAYRATGGVLHQPDVALVCLTGTWLAWLAYNLERCLDPTHDAQQRALGRRETVSTLGLLRQLTNGRSEYLAWCAAANGRPTPASGKDLGE